MELQEAMARLQEAAINGNVASLRELLSNHRQILDIELYHFKQSTLYLALNLGHLDFANAILVHKPELASKRIIGHLSSSFTTALHICSEKGYLEIVRSLLNNSSASSMCLAQDSDGRNPLHLAAIQGHLEVLQALIEAVPLAAREHTSQSSGGETVLHLCVKHRQLETLAFLIDEIGVGDFLNSTDIHGNTILHLAVSSKQTQIVEYLVTTEGINKNAKNTNGLTVMDICTKSSKDIEHDDIWKTLELAKAMSSKDKITLMFEHQREAMMVVASLIATMLFQLGVNPPGGVWQDNGKDHVAGESILAYQNPEVYALISTTNNFGFIWSIVALLLLVNGLSLDRMRMYLLKGVLSSSIMLTIFSYEYSTLQLNDSEIINPEMPKTSTILPIVSVLPVVIVCFYMILGLAALDKREKYALISRCRRSFSYLTQLLPS